MPMRMSAFGPKQTWRVALHMSAFGGKPDMVICAACSVKQREERSRSRSPTHGSWHANGGRQHRHGSRAWQEQGLPPIEAKALRGWRGQNYKNRVMQG